MPSRRTTTVRVKRKPVGDPKLIGQAVTSPNPYEGRSIADLEFAEVALLANRAWNEAAQSALQQGHAVTGLRDGKIVKRYSDGREEVLEPLIVTAGRSEPPL